MRIGFVELVLLLFIASLTVGPNVALFVDRWLRRAQRTSAAAARRKAQLEAQAAIEREALLTRFRVASNVFALLLLAALAYGLLLRPIETPPKAYTVPDVRQDTGAARTELSADSKDGWKLGDYLGVDCVRTQDGLVYAAAYDGASMKKRKSDLVRTDGGHDAAILSVEGELTGFAFDGNGDLWLTVVTPTGGTLCRARHDSWGTSVEPVVTQLDGAPLGALSAGGRTAKASFPACRATPVHWRWTRTASSTSAIAGRAATGWKRTRTAPCCGASPCGPVKICSRSCSACRRTRPALRRWIRRTAAGSGPSRAGRWTAAPQSARRAAKCISVRQALPACCRQECKRGVFYDGRVQKADRKRGAAGCDRAAGAGKAEKGGCLCGGLLVQRDRRRAHRQGFQP